MKSSFFVRKRRKRYGCEMPALRAISSVEAPERPCSANASRAASSTWARRSSADFLSAVAGVTRCKLSLTYKCCQGLRNAIELGIGELCVERQCERPLEAGVRAGEGALIAVGRQAMQRVGADLALDPLRAELCHDAVTVVELD